MCWGSSSFSVAAVCVLGLQLTLCAGQLGPDEAAEWYSKVDSNNSGKIEKGEFMEVMRYVCPLTACVSL